jgi:hypothetical protein
MRLNSNLLFLDGYLLLERVKRIFDDSNEFDLILYLAFITLTNTHLLLFKTWNSYSPPFLIANSNV